MKQLHNKVNIVPVIAKADVLTKKEVADLKTRVMKEITGNGIKVYSLPDVDEDEDEDYKEEVRQLKEAMPFAVSGSTTFIEAKGKKVRGRLYPWGVVEIENPEHSDFVKLRTMLITHMQDLQEVTQEVHYENYRLQKLASEARAGLKAELIMDQKGVDKDEMKRILQEKEAELKKMQEIMAKMQAEMSVHKV
jgi:septin 2